MDRRGLLVLVGLLTLVQGQSCPPEFSELVMAITPGVLGTCTPGVLVARGNIYVNYNLSTDYLTVRSGLEVPASGLTIGGIIFNGSSIDVNWGDIINVNTLYTNFLNVSGLAFFSDTVTFENTVVFAGGFSITADLDMAGFKVINLADPSNVADAVTKQYADALAQGLFIHRSARAITTGVITGFATEGGPNGIGHTITSNANEAISSRAAAFDDVALALNDRVLVTQVGFGTATASGVGAYLVTAAGDGSNPWVLTRSTAMDEPIELHAGCYVFVTEGTQYADTGWVDTTDTPYVDFNKTAFIQFSHAGVIQAGYGLSMTGTTLSVVGPCGLGTSPTGETDSMECVSTGTASTWNGVAADYTGVSVISSSDTQFTPSGGSVFTHSSVLASEKVYLRQGTTATLVAAVTHSGGDTVEVNVTLVNTLLGASLNPLFQQFSGPVNTVNRMAILGTDTAYATGVGLNVEQVFLAAATLCGVNNQGPTPHTFDNIAIVASSYSSVVNAQAAAPNAHQRQFFIAACESCAAISTGSTAQVNRAMIGGYSLDDTCGDNSLTTQNFCVQTITLGGPGSTLTLNPATLGSIDRTAVGSTTAAAGNFTDLSATTSFVSAAGAGTAGYIMVSQDTSGTAAWANANTALNLTCGLGTTPTGETDSMECVSTGVPTTWDGVAADYTGVSVISSSGTQFTPTGSTVFTHSSVVAAENVRLRQGSRTTLVAAVTQDAGNAYEVNITLVNTVVAGSWNPVFQQRVGLLSTVNQAAVMGTDRVYTTGVGLNAEQLFMAASALSGLYNEGPTAHTFDDVAIVASYLSAVENRQAAAPSAHQRRIFIAACYFCVATSTGSTANVNRAMIGGAGLDDTCGDNSLTTQNFCAKTITLGGPGSTLTLNPATLGSIDRTAVGTTVAAAGNFTDLSATTSFVSAAGAGTAGYVMVSQDTSGTAAWANINTALNLTCVAAPTSPSAGTTPYQVVSCSQDPFSTTPTVWPAPGVVFKQVVVLGTENTRFNSGTIAAERVLIAAATSIDVSDTLEEVGVLASANTALRGTHRQVVVLASTGITDISANIASRVGMGIIASGGFIMQGGGVLSAFARVALLASQGTVIGNTPDEDMVMYNMATVASTGTTYMGGDAGWGNLYINVATLASQGGRMKSSFNGSADSYTNVAILATTSSGMDDSIFIGIPTTAKQTLVAACESCLIKQGDAVNTLVGGAKSTTLWGNKYQLVVLGSETITTSGATSFFRNMGVLGSLSVSLDGSQDQVGVLGSTGISTAGLHREVAILACNGVVDTSTLLVWRSGLGFLASAGITVDGGGGSSTLTQISVVASSATTIGDAADADMEITDMATVASSGTTYSGGDAGVGNMYSNVATLASEDARMKSSLNTSVDSYTNTAVLATITSGLDDSGSVGTATTTKQTLVAACESCLIKQGDAFNMLVAGCKTVTLWGDKYQMAVLGSETVTAALVASIFTHVGVLGSLAVSLDGTHNQVAVLGSTTVDMKTPGTLYEDWTVLGSNNILLEAGGGGTYAVGGVLGSRGIAVEGSNIDARRVVIMATLGLGPGGKVLSGDDNSYVQIMTMASNNPRFVTSGATTVADSFTNVAMVATTNAKVWDGGDTGLGNEVTMKQILIAACDSCTLGTVPGTANNRVIMGGTSLDGDTCGDDSLTTHNLCVNNITVNDGANMVLDSTTGTQIGTAATQKLGLWGATPVVQPATTNTTAGYTHPGTGTFISTDACTTGGLGSSCYTYADIVLALKKLGALAL